MSDCLGIGGVTQGAADLYGAYAQSQTNAANLAAQVARQNLVQQYMSQYLTSPQSGYSNAIMQFLAGGRAPGAGVQGAPPTYGAPPPLPGVAPAPGGILPVQSPYTPGYGGQPAPSSGVRYAPGIQPIQSPYAPAPAPLPSGGMTGGPVAMPTQPDLPTITGSPQALAPYTGAMPTFAQGVAGTPVPGFEGWGQAAPVYAAQQGTVSIPGWGNVPLGSLGQFMVDRFGAPIPAPGTTPVPSGTVNLGGTSAPWYGPPPTNPNSPGGQTYQPYPAQTGVALAPGMANVQFSPADVPVGNPTDPQHPGSPSPLPQPGMPSGGGTPVIPPTGQTGGGQGAIGPYLPSATPPAQGAFTGTPGMPSFSLPSIYNYQPQDAFTYNPATFGSTPLEGGGRSGQGFSLTQGPLSLGPTGTQGFNAGQDPLMQAGSRGPNGPSLQQLTPGIGQYDNSGLFAAMKQAGDLNLNQQVSNLQGSAGSLGARFGTALNQNEALLRANAVAQMNLQNQQVASGSYENAQQRQLQAQLANLNALNQAGQFNAAAGQTAYSANAQQGNIFNQLMLGGLGQAAGLQQGQQGANTGLLGLLAGLPIPQQAPSPYPGAIGSIGQLATLYPFLSQIYRQGQTGA